MKEKNPKKLNKTINFDAKFGALWLCPCLPYRYRNSGAPNKF